MDELCISFILAAVLYLAFGGLLSVICVRETADELADKPLGHVDQLIPAKHDLHKKIDAIGIIAMMLWPSVLFFSMGYYFGILYYKAIVIKQDILSAMIPWTNLANKDYQRKIKF